MDESEEAFNEMNQLNVLFQQEIGYFDPINTISCYLNKEEKHSLSYAPWHTHEYKPDVSFSIGYGPDSLFLKYIVSEKCIRAVHSKVNSPVYQDSCVEFFFSLDAGVSYYNFEFNCIGTPLVSFGKERSDRIALPKEVVEKIKCLAVIKRDSETIDWELTVAIPFKTLIHHQVTSLKGQECRANFYKCGDLLPEPHFLCWANIEAPEPDFHLPRFFGKVNFE